MAGSEGIERVQKTTETSASKPAGMPEEAERVAPNKEHFQSLIGSNDPLRTSFERVGESGVAPDAKEIQEKNPVFTEESSSSQKSGSATDQERKGGRQNRGDDEKAEGVSGVGGSKNKSSIESSSLMSELNRLNSQVKDVSKGTPAEIRSQVKEIVSQIEVAKTKLSTVQDIKPSYQNLLRSRLTHIDDNLKIALSKAGVENPSAVSSASGSSGTGMNPVKKFIDSLTSSQAQLENLQASIAESSAAGKALSPAEMLTVQIKMNLIQQQVELFTNLLNKALESTKTIMNVQV